MLDDRIGKLSDMQKRCLRLSAEGRTSKEIAPLVGLSHQTVDQYLHRARVILGAGSRREATRIFLEIEGQAPFKRLELKSAEVADPQISRISEAAVEQAPQPHRLLGLPPIGGQPNDLTLAQRFMTIGKIALFLMIVVLTMILIIKGAFRVLS